jgi:hypothetical protein
MSDFAIFGVSADAQQVKGLYEAGGSGVNGIRWMFVWEKIGCLFGILQGKAMENMGFHSEKWGSD